MRANVIYEKGDLSFLEMMVLTFDDMKLFYIFLGIVSLVALSLFAVYIITTYRSLRLPDVLSLVLVLAFFSLLMFFGIAINIQSIKEMNKESPSYQQHYEKWKQEYALPYFEDLEIERYNVKNFSIRPSNENYNTNFIGEEPELIPGIALLSDENGQAKTIEGLFKVQYDLKEGDTPYLETKKLNSDLGFNLDAGYYNNTLHFVDDKQHNEKKTKNKKTLSLSQCFLWFILIRFAYRLFLLVLLHTLL